MIRALLQWSFSREVKRISQFIWLPRDKEDLRRGKDDIFNSDYLNSRYTCFPLFYIAFILSDHLWKSIHAEFLYAFRLNNFKSEINM